VKNPTDSHRGDAENAEDGKRWIDKAKFKRQKDKCLRFLRVLRVSVVIVLGIFVFVGCKSRSRYSELKLPLPPVADSGVTEDQYVQTQYGFGFPLPSRWHEITLSQDQEVDEVARLADPGRDITVHIAVQLLPPSEKFSKKSWQEACKEDLKARLFRIKREDEIQEWKTLDSHVWVTAPFHAMDQRGDGWLEQDWVLNNGDLLIGVHADMDEDTAGMEKGKKLLKALADALSQIHWYTPIGTRGISLERYELNHFTADFCRALESRSLPRVDHYLDDLYPEKAKWDQWYKDLCSSKDGSPAELKADLSGLIINEDKSTATASFTILKKEKGSAKPQKLDRSFRLAKPEGRWRIQAALGKS